jgi:Tol biopolymer transport system component
VPLLLVASTGIAAALSAAPPAGKPRTILVSRQSAAKGGEAGNASSESPVVSASGRFAAFSSEATNLGGTPGVDRNAYLYDRRRKRLVFIARHNRSGAKADGENVVQAISDDGRYAAFATDATNLGGPITPGVANVYVYDRVRERIALVSRRSARAGGAGGNDDSFDADISGNGRFVAFTSQATNFGGATVQSVYSYDRERRRLELASRASRAAGGAPADGESGEPEISAAGRFVAFQTEADNLGGDVADVQNIYVYDRKRKRVRVVSRQGGTGGAGVDADAEHPAISGNGRFASFRTQASNLGGPAMPGVDNVYLYDRKALRVQLVSRRGDVGADAVSYESSLDHRGRFVAFDTEATNLGGGIQALQNVYLFDRKTKRTTLLSRRSGRSGAPADDDSLDPHVSRGGRFVGFQSSGGNLSPAAPGPPFSSAYIRDRGR